MNIESYNQIVEKNKPNENKLLNIVKAFITGGLIGMLGHFLIQFYSYKFNVSTNDAGILMITTLIFLACLFTALGIFDVFAKFAKMGVIIPITGFAHSIQAALLDYKKEGLIYGFGSNCFKLAGSVILYGVVGACLFGFLRFIIM